MTLCVATLKLHGTTLWKVAVCTCIWLAYMWLLIYKYNATKCMFIWWNWYTPACFRCHIKILPLKSIKAVVFSLAKSKYQVLATLSPALSSDWWHNFLPELFIFTSINDRKIMTWIIIHTFPISLQSLYMVTNFRCVIIIYSNRSCRKHPV